MKLYLAAFSIAYYRLLRVGEVGSGPHQIKAKDIHVGSNKDKILIVMHTSKTHGVESTPQKIKIEAVQTMKQNYIFCPFNLLRNFLKVRGNYMIDSEPCFIMRDRSAVTQEQLRKTLRLMLENIGLKPELYNFHSLHAGRATQMLNFGYSFQQIQFAGRWRSTTAVMKYLKP